MPHPSDKSGPEISVIIPVYNTEKYLRQCLDSVLHQTFQNWEALLFDDCSSDNSLRILKEYARKDSRFKIFQNSSNIGPGETRNNALKTACGKWVMFLDADDFWEPDLIRRVAGAAQTTKHPLICFSFIRTDENGKDIYAMPFLFKHPAEHHWQEKLFHQTGLTTDKAFRLSFLKQWNLQFAQDRLYCEDVLFVFCALLRAKGFYYLPAYGHHYRQTPGSCTENLDKLLWDWQKVQYLLKRELKRLGVFHNKWYGLLCASLFTPHITPKKKLSPVYVLHYRRTRKIMRNLRCTSEDFKDNIFCSYEKYQKICSRPFCLFHLHRKNIPALIQLFAAHMKRSVQNLLK